MLAHIVQCGATVWIIRNFTANDARGCLRDSLSRFFVHCSVPRSRVFGPARLDKSIKMGAALLLPAIVHGGKLHARLEHI